MPQFCIRLPENVLQADKIESVRSFAERTDWTGLPSSTHLHAGVISVVLRPPDTDTSLAEEALLLLATQRILFYLESPSRSRAVDVHLLYSWIERIERIINAYKDEESDVTQVFKDKMHLSIELLKKATSLIHSDKLASEVLYASGSEIGVSADIQTAKDSSERMKLALEVAEIAKLHSFNEQTIIPNPSIGNAPVSPEPYPDDSSIRDHYQAIVFAFGDLITSTAPLIGDESLLPYPKKTILYAIRWVMDHYESLREKSNNPTLLDLCDKMLPTLSYLLTTLARDWHQIEPDDKETITKLNRCDSFPEWALKLKAKYIDDDKASNEAYDVAIQVIKDKVAFEKRHGKSKENGPRTKKELDEEFNDLAKQLKIILETKRNSL